MVNTKIRLLILFAVKDGEALYNQQKQDQKLIVRQLTACVTGRKEGQGSPNRGNRLQVPDIFISHKQQEDTNQRYFFLRYTNVKGFY